MLYRYLGNGLAAIFPTLPDRGTTPGAMRRWWKILKARFENGRRVSASQMYKDVSIPIVNLTEGVNNLIESGLHINLVDGEVDEAEAAADDDDAGSPVAMLPASHRASPPPTPTRMRVRCLGLEPSRTLTPRAATPPSLVSPF